MKTTHEQIRESEIEDALVTYLDILRNILGVEVEARLIGRQIRLQDGERRLDLLLAVQNQIYLIELKVEPFKSDFLTQILGYKEELSSLQEQKRLIAGEIVSVLLVTDCSEAEIERCKESGVELKRYSPVEVLTEYFAKMSTVATFLKLRPIDLGVFNIGLVNRVMKALDNGKVRKEEIAKESDLSKISVEHHLVFSQQLGLIVERSGRFHLTTLGNRYMEGVDITLPGDALSEEQSSLLRDHIANDPFSSPIVFGIYSIVESAFFLARNEYPIPFNELRDFFQKVSGKRHEWTAKRTLSTATYTYLNYAVRLGLLGKIGNQVIITPAGFRFILMLQLHKSIEMVESFAAK